MRPIPTPEAPTLNLVALMDIFTILVFFLMVNSSHAGVMEGESSMKLPAAYSDKVAGPTLKMTIINNTLFLQGRQIARLDGLDLTAESIPALRTELDYQATKSAIMSQEEEALGRPITLFADESVPYEVLRLVLATCASTDYRNVSLAVEAVDDMLNSDENLRRPMEVGNV